MLSEDLRNELAAIAPQRGCCRLGDTLTFFPACRKRREPSRRAGFDRLGASRPVVKAGRRGSSEDDLPLRSTALRNQ